MATYLKQHSRILKIEGGLLVALGLLAIVVPRMFTFGIELLIGIVLLVTGLLSAVRAIRLQGLPGTGMALMYGILAALVGILLLANPLSGAITLTLLLGLLFLVQGASETATALQHREWPSWVWILLSGIASLVIGLVLLLGLPGTAAWAVGLLVGINLLFTGSWLFLLGRAVGDEIAEEPLDTA